jgi:hypothetical protein
VPFCSALSQTRCVSSSWQQWLQHLLIPATKCGWVILKVLKHEAVEPVQAEGRSRDCMLTCWNVRDVRYYTFVCPEIFTSKHRSEQLEPVNVNSTLHCCKCFLFCCPVALLPPRRRELKTSSLLRPSCCVTFYSNLRDSRIAQRCCWGFGSCGMWRRVGGKFPTFRRIVMSLSSGLTSSSLSHNTWIQNRIIVALFWCLCRWFPVVPVLLPWMVHRTHGLRDWYRLHGSCALNGPS